MPWDIHLDVGFTMAYASYIVNLLKVNGIPIYLIALALIAVTTFFEFVAYMVAIFKDRFFDGGG